MTVKQVPGGVMSVVFGSAIRTALEDAKREDVDIQVFDTLPSTNEYLSQLSADTASDEELLAFGPRLCVTDWQTQGNGRRGKAWQSERGNITFSILTVLPKPAGELLGLSLVTGVSVAATLMSAIDLTVKLKWPNDLIVGDAKLGGLLIELQPATSAQSTRVITGIGVNYRHSDAFDQLGIGATSLLQHCEESPSRTQLIGRLTASVLAGHEQFVEQGWAAFASTWDSLDYLKGNEVSVIRDEQPKYATAVGVDEKGALLIERDGLVEPVYSGDVSVRLST